MPSLALRLVATAASHPFAACVTRPTKPLLFATAACRGLTGTARAAAFAMAKEFKLKDVGASVDLKPGDKKEVEVEGLEDAKVLLVNAGGTVQAIGPKCTHYGAPLVKGVLMKNGRLTCPWHGGKHLSAQ
jgi:nitrite reductase/ring-hydroxylating ferredoxin subunit